jgi:alkylation response protein AidB-like acyl-CoA dehydrogenase
MIAHHLLARGRAAAHPEHGHQLEPLTPAGRRFCALAGEHAAAALARAADADREGRLPLESLREMQASGFAAATVPAALGGGGLDSLYDLAVGLGRLGRADASTAAAMNVHLSTAWRMAFHARTDPRAGDRFDAVLRRVGEGRLLLCSLAAEADTDGLHPLAEARREGDGWRIDGAKVFGTLAEGADLLQVSVRAPAPGGGWTSCIAGVPAGTPGMEIRGGGDALGMRGSGSHTVEFRGCRIPHGMLHPVGPWGEWTLPAVEAQVSGGIGVLGACLGVAEAARAQVVAGLATRTARGAAVAERAGIQHHLAELEVTLASLRAVLGRAGLLADGFFAARAPGAPDDMEGAHRLFREFQCAASIVNRGAVEVVDAALTLSGGSAAAGPLARLYRDVRSGPFMQLSSPTEAMEYIGKAVLGLEPAVL